MAEEEEEEVDIQEVTSYFSGEKYSGEILAWAASHGSYQVLVRPSQQQQVQSVGE